MKTERKIRVAMISRPNLFQVIGGDSIQVKKTAEALMQLFPCEISLQPDIPINKTNFDLIHFFNVICPEDILGHLKKDHPPYAISTIYVDYREYDKYHRKDIVGTLSQFLSKNQIEYIKTFAKFLLKKEKVSSYKYFFSGHQSSIKRILSNAAILLPNSENEYKRLIRDFPIEKPYLVVPNAIDPKLFNAGRSNERNIVLCVGRIEGNKNQLNLIKAINGTPFKLVLIGAPAPNQKSYYQQCYKEAGENIQFIDFLPQEKLLEYYRKARVHVLPSWFETTGLSSLEAAAMGCNIVVGDRGDVRDYFGEFAEYCEPGDIQSIKSAIKNAWDKIPDPAFTTKIIQEYNWEKTAQKTWEAYQIILNKNAQ